MRILTFHRAAIQLPVEPGDRHARYTVGPIYARAWGFVPLPMWLALLLIGRRAPCR